MPPAPSRRPWHGKLHIRQPARADRTASIFPPMGERHASTLEWRQIARGPRPLYHVLTWPGIEDWTPEDFYAVGESDWEDFSDHWRHYAGELDGTCLEIGSGAGRISRMLGSEFDHVHSLD